MWFYVSTCFKKYFDFTGRARRKEYWYFELFNLIILFLLFIVHFLSKKHFVNTLSNFYLVFILIPSLAVMFRRTHAIGHNGWFVLLLFVLSGLMTYAVTYVFKYVMERYVMLHLTNNAASISHTLTRRFPQFLSVIGMIAGELPSFYFFTKDSKPGKNKYGSNPKDIEK